MAKNHNEQKIPKITMANNFPSNHNGHKNPHGQKVPKNHNGKKVAKNLNEQQQKNHNG